MADKDADFDPYHKWLGIPREQRPVTYYQLLGISPNETDIDVIEDAATRQSSHVRTYQLGNHAEACQRLLNEISQAKTTLLNPEKRKAYHAQVVKVEKPRPKTAPSKPSEDRPRTRPKAAKPNTGMILGIAGAGVVALAALGRRRYLAGSGPPSTGQTTKKTDPKIEPTKPVVVAEKKPPTTPKIVESPKTVEPKKDGVDLKVETRSCGATTCPRSRS